MRPGEVGMELSRIGFRFRLDGEAVKVRFAGECPPDPAAVFPLLDVVKAHKEDVRYFLKFHCPRCGGVVFVPDYKGVSLCLRCDWERLAKLYPGLREKH